MRVLVTGARGKVGRSAVPALRAAGHDLTITDLAPPDHEPAIEGEPWYVAADLTDAGQVYALFAGGSGVGPRDAGFDAVVHAAAIPAPGRHAPHVVFTTNVAATFNVVEACVRTGVRRLVNLSSEAALGHMFADRPSYPRYLPMDEDHPCAPQDPYGLSKVVGERICDAAVARSDLRCVSLRPSWVQDGESYVRHLGPNIANPDDPMVNGWSYVDAADLADLIRLAVECDLPGHEVFFAASPDTVGGRDLHRAWQAAYPDAKTELRAVPRPDAAGVSSEKAVRVLGWRPTRGWRDHLTPAGQPLNGATPPPGA
jgi:UDP-glucose 4-epimerase